jgi:phage terminase large subunit
VAEARIVIPYAPRDLQRRVHDELDRTRFVVVVAHRRFGKTVLAVNHLIRAALTCTRERPRTAYVAPTYRQAKTIAWDYLRTFTEVIPGVAYNETELRCDLPNGGQVRLYGADSPDSLRGTYFDAVVLDEVGMMQSRAWTEVIRPALADRMGTALFIGTPNGRNLFWDLRERATQAEGWALHEFRASVTGIVPEAELADAKRAMSEDAFNQEFECDFLASVRGAIYAKEFSWLRENGRITRVSYDPLIPVQTCFDLGIGDSTAIWFLQLSGAEVRAIDYYEASGEALGHYVNVLRGKGYTYGRHIVPHDAEVRELGSGRTRLEILQGLGVQAEVCRKTSLDDGIEATRIFLKRMWFDQVKTQPGVEALTSYRWDYNTRLDEHKGTPVHDWSSHAADALRYGALALTELARQDDIKLDTSWII